MLSGATTVTATQYISQDVRGNVTEVSGVTPSGFQVAQAVTYDAWGVPSVATQGSEANGLLWKGLKWDADASLYYMRARWYDPALGRFISEDPIGIAGGISLYGFADGDPIGGFDPTGLSACKVIVGPDGKPVEVECDPVHKLGGQRAMFDPLSFGIIGISSMNMGGPSDWFALGGRISLDAGNGSSGGGAQTGLDEVVADMSRGSEGKKPVLACMKETLIGGATFALGATVAVGTVLGALHSVGTPLPAIGVGAVSLMGGIGGSFLTGIGVAEFLAAGTVTSVAAGTALTLGLGAVAIAGGLAAYCMF